MRSLIGILNRNQKIEAGYDRTIVEISDLNGQSIGNRIILVVQLLRHSCEAYSNQPGGINVEWQRNPRIAIGSRIGITHAITISCGSLGRITLVLNVSNHGADGRILNNSYATNPDPANPIGIAQLNNGRSQIPLRHLLRTHHGLQVRGLVDQGVGGGQISHYACRDRRGAAGPVGVEQAAHGVGAGQVEWRVAAALYRRHQGLDQGAPPLAGGLADADQVGDLRGPLLHGKGLLAFGCGQLGVGQGGDRIQLIEGLARSDAEGLAHTVFSSLQSALGGAAGEAIAHLQDQ